MADFSDNFDAKQQKEIMSAHWVKNAITLYTAVITTIESTKSYVVVSDELHHDKFSVTTVIHSNHAEQSQDNFDISFFSLIVYLCRNVESVTFTCRVSYT